MAHDKVSHLLGTLQEDPENEAALTALAERAGEGAPGIDPEDLRLLAKARAGHEARAEFRAVVFILELEASAAQDDPDRASELYKRAGDLWQHELLDDERATHAYGRALALRPGDDEIQEAHDAIEQTSTRWAEVVKRFTEEAEGTDGAKDLAASLWVRAACLVWKYKRKGRDKQVDQLFSRALEANPGDARALRLYERVLRARGKWAELAELLLEGVERVADRDEKVTLLLRAARVFDRHLDAPARAAACHERILDYAPGNSISMTYLARFFTEAEDWDHLVALYEDALRSRTKLEDEQGALMQLAMVHWRFRNSPEEAEPYFARLRKMDPSHPGMLGFYREQLADDPDPQRWVTILTDAQRVASTDEQKLRLAVELARAAEQSASSTERAIDGWKAVLRLDPTNEDAPAALITLYEKTEKWNALVELLKARAEALGDEHAEQKVALYRQLVPIYRDKLGLDVMVINTYNAILQLEPGDAEALAALSEAYESTGRWNELIGVLSRKADATDDVGEQVELQLRIANLWIERFANYNQATQPLERVIELDPEHREALQQLKEIYRKKRAWTSLYDVLSKEARLASDPSARLEHRVELAKLAGERLHRHADAIALWKDVLEEDASSTEAVDALEKLAEREKDWPTLAEVLERRVTESDGEKERMKLLSKLGVIYGEHMDDPARAASAWKRILDIDPKNGRALRTLRESFSASGDWDGLEALYEELGDWEGLVDVLGNAADRVDDPEVKIDVSFRAAAIYADKLEQPHRAFRCYERVLSVDPDNAAAAEALIPIYERDEKWNRLPALYEVLLRATPRNETDRRLELLESLRTLALERTSDSSSAFDHMARAFEVAPRDASVRMRLEDAADRAGRDADLVDVYLARLAKVDSASEPEAEAERLWLRRRVADIAVERLGQPERAVEQLTAVLELEPDDAEAAEALARIYTAQGQHRQLRGLLLHRVSHAQSDEERVEHLGALAALEAEVLEDEESAGNRFRAILEIDPRDPRALAALDRYAEAGQRWGELADVLLRRAEVADSDDARADLISRLGEVRIGFLDDPAGALEAFGEVLRYRPEDAAAISGLERVSAADAGLAERAGHLLDGAYERTGDWEKLASVLQARLARTDDEGERRAIRMRYAEIAATKVGDPAAAYQALEDAFLADPTDQELWARLVDAAEAADAHEALAAAFAIAMDIETLGPDEQAMLAGKVAHLYDVVLARPEDAEPFHRKVLAHDPLDERAFEALKELYTNGERWEALQVLYRARIEQTLDGDAKLDLLMQVCFLFEELIDDAELAIGAYRDVLELDPGHAASRRALERLYERTERWQDLVTLLRMELDEASEDERVGLTQRLGVLHEKRIGDVVGAVDHYEQVLVLEPNHKHAREALERLLPNEGQRQRIARILEPVFEDRGDWPELTEVLSVQLEDVSDLGSRVALLTRIADIQENRLHDTGVAFATVAKAVEADPADGMVRAELARLAGMRDAEKARAAVLERAIEAAEHSPTLQAELLLEVGTVWDEKVGDVDRAESAYARLIEVAGDDPETVLGASRALERIHLGRGDHAALAEDLRRQIRFETDPEERRRLLVRLGDLLEEVLEDRAGAIAAHRERLDLDPADLDASAALERLYEQAGEWQQLIGILQNRDGVVTDESEQRAIAKRIGMIYEEKLDDHDNAVIAYNDALSRFGRDREVLTALSRLYERAERWQDLLDVAEMVLDMAEHGAERAVIQFQMAELMRLRTGELERAIEGYREVLELDRDHAGALASLAEMMGASASAGAEPPDDGASVASEPGADGELDAADEGASEEAPESSTRELPIEIRIDAARALVPHYEARATPEAYRALLEALEVLASSDDPLERYRSLRRGAEVADLGLEDSGRAFELQGDAVRAGLAEDDLGHLLADYRRFAEATERWEAYAKTLEEVAPEVLDGDLAVQVTREVADVARERLGQPDRARRHYERVLEQRPDDAAALDALESLTMAGGDHAALREVLRRKTELADTPDERTRLLLRRAELAEQKLDDLTAAIECYDQALGETQPEEAYLGLERLYAKAERPHDLAMHYERMLDDGIGERVEIRYRLAMVHSKELSDAWTATEQLREALATDPSHEPSIAALEALMDDEELRGVAAEILEPVFLQQLAWPKVIACLEARLLAEADVDARKGLLTRLGQLHEDYLEDLEGALEAYARLFREDPRDEATWETLGRLARVLERWDRLAEIYGAALEEITIDDPSTAKLAMTAGQLHEQRTGDRRAAAGFFERALRFDPESHDAFVALETVLEALEDYERLLELYREQAQASASEDDRVALLRKSARLLETRLGRPEQAIESHRDILMIDPGDPNAISALDELLEKRERWSELADHVRHQIELEEDVPDQLDLKFRLATLLGHQLEDRAASVDMLEEIVATDPHHADAVQALERMVQEAEGQLRIIQILEPIYQATDQWRKRIAIYEAQVQLDEDPIERVRLLGEIARLHEDRSNDAHLAFHAYSRAFAIEPENEAVRGEVDRLGAQLGTWDAHVAAYEAAVTASSDPSTVSSLLTTMARVHDEKRGDPRAAIETYERLVEHDPDDPSPLDSLEALHTMVGDWRGLVDVLDRKVKRAFDPAERGELLRRAGSVLEELLGDRAGAVEAYRQALVEDDADLIALESLDRLYGASGQQERLGEILRRRLELETDVGIRVEVALRLGALAEGELRQPDEAIEAFQRALDDEPGQPEAVAALARLYERQRMWPELLDNLRLQSATAESHEDRVALLHRAAAVLEREMDDVLEAIPLYEEVLGLDSRHEASIAALMRISKLEDYRAQAAEILEPLLRAQDRWDDLAQVIEGKVAAAYDPFEKRTELRRLAEVHELGRNDLEAAFDANRRALGEDPADVAVADDIERLAEAFGDWARAADVFAVRASSVLEPAVARALYARLARIAEERLEDDMRAIEAHSRALEHAMEDVEALAALDRLYLKTTAWPDLAEILERRIGSSVDPAERAELLVRLGSLRAEHFQDRRGALRSFTEVLERDPAEPRAMEALEGLLGDDDLAPEVVEILDAAYRQTGATEKVAALYDVRIPLADSDGERVRLLAEQAALLEQELGDPMRALAATRRAFLLDPRDETLVDDLERLAPAAGDWDSLRGLVEQVSEQDDVDRLLLKELNLRAARWYRDFLGDAEAAEARLRAAIAADPDAEEAHQQLVELLAAPGREEALVEALVGWAEVELDETARKSRLREAASLAQSALSDLGRAASCHEAILATDPVDREALDALIHIERERASWPRVAELLERRIDAEIDPDARIELRKELGRTASEHLDDAARALDAWRGALDEDPTDLESMAALEALHEKAERWEEVEQLIERRLEVAETPADRIAARVRLARLVEQRFGRRDEAMTQLREILEEDPQNPEALDELERLLGVSEQWDELVELLERRVAEASSSGDAAGELARSVRLAEVHRVHRQDALAAIAIYERVTERDPSNVDALTALAQIHEERGDHGPRLDVLERLAGLAEPADAIAIHYEIAETALSSLEDPVRAEIALRAAYDLDPSSVEAREKLKAHYEAQARPDRLAEMLLLDEAEAEAAEDKAAILKRVADLYAGPLSDPGTAASYLERAAELVPEDRDILLPLCDLYIAAGRQSDAIPVLEKIVESYGSRRNKEVAVYHHRLGRAKETMGDLDGAMEAYDAAFKVDLTNVQVLRDLGRLCMARGDLDRAQKTFRALLLQKLSPDDGISKADVYFHLGDISGRQGDNRKAVSMLERAVAEDSDHAEAQALLAQLKG